MCNEKFDINSFAQLRDENRSIILHRQILQRLVEVGISPNDIEYSLNNHFKL